MKSIPTLAVLIGGAFLGDALCPMWGAIIGSLGCLLLLFCLIKHKNSSPFAQGTNNKNTTIFN